MFNVAIYVESDADELAWSYLLSNFKPDNIILLEPWQNSNLAFTDALLEIPVFSYRVLFTPETGMYKQGEVSLINFNHPKDATYIFGKNMANNDIECDETVYIPTDTHDEMFASYAAAVALWDRKIRG